MAEIVSTMTVREAAALLPMPDQILLKRWSETFGIRLSEFHIGHIKTYQIDRATEVEAAVVDCEVEALINQLRKLGLTQEIERYYKPLIDPAELTTEELHALPLRVRKYIEALKEKISELRVDKAHVEDQFKDLRRKHNWSRARY